MSDINTIVEDLETDLMNIEISIPTQHLSENQIDSPSSHQRLASDSGSVSGNEESNKDSSRKVLVSGSAKTVDATKACSTESLTNDRQKSAYRKYQSNPLQKDKLAINGKLDEWHINKDENYTSRRIAHIPANAGMIYKGSRKNSNGEIVYVMVECCDCHMTMYFKLDEDPHAEHMKLNPTCKRFQ